MQGDGHVGVRNEPYAYVEPNWPCSQCGHLFKEHKFMYGFGVKDRYRCQRCECGKQYEIVIALLPADVDTDEKREEWIKRYQEAARIEKERFGNG